MEELVEFEGSERFELRDPLGAGAVGTVYRAWDKDRGQEVALKFLRTKAADALYKFKREFRTLADVAHPNLVTLYELFADTAQWYFTMEVVDGVNILEDVRPADQLDVERLRDALRQLAEGIAALHDAGKLHRDLKPSNVMVTQEGRVLILDFGVATDLRPEEQSGEGMIVGTIAYMAPEQAAGTTTSAVTDWYAFGTILFQALTGRLPFTGGLYEVIVAKQTQTPPSPDDFAEGLPEDLVDLCRRLLVREPTMRPTGAEVLLALGAAADENLHSTHSTAEKQLLVGREAPMAELADAYQATRRGQAVVVYVYGESGMGKTALVQSFLSSHGAKGIVLRGRCYQREMVPFKALDGVIDSLSRYLAGRHRDELAEILPPGVRSLVRLFPVLARVEMPKEAAHDEAPLAGDLVALRRQAFGALRELFTRLAWRRPLVLYVDDLQWADADSIVLIDELLRPPNPPPLMLVASFRSEEIGRHGLLQDLLKQPVSDVRRRLEIGPLDDEQSYELALALLGADSDMAAPFLRAIVQEGKGSPFLVEQLSRFIQAQADRISTGMTLSELLGARLLQLPEGCRPLLLTMAVANRPLNTMVARRAAAIDGDVERLIGALRAAHLVRWSGTETQLELYHDRIRETLVTFLDQVEQRQVHGRLAEALVALGHNDPEALFQHYLGAGERDKAAQQAVLAARKALDALAFEPAASYFGQALTLGAARSEDELNELRRGLAESYANAGRTAEAAAAYLDLAGGGVTDFDALEARCLAVEQFLIGGDVEDGLRAARHTLGQVGLGMPRGSRRALLRLLFNRLRLRLRGVGFEQRDESAIERRELVRIDTCWAMAKGLSLVNTIQGADFQTRHLLMALRAGEPYRVACALAMEAGFVASSGDGERSEELLDEAMTLARRVDHPHAIGVALLQRGVLEYFTGRSWPAAVAAFDEAEKVLIEGCRGIVWELNFCRRFGLAAMRNLGEIGELKTRVPLCLAEARDRGNRSLANTVRSRLSIVWLADDDPETARREAAESQRAASDSGYTVNRYNVLRAELEADLYTGDGRSARQRVEAAWKRLSKSMVFRVQMPRIEAQEIRGRAALAYAAAPQGFPESQDLLLKTAADAAEKILAEKKAWAKPLARSLQAGIAALQGDDARARQLLESAADGFEATHSHLHAAVARRRLGALIGGDSGQDLFNRAELWMRRQQIKNTDAMTAMILPGFRS